VLGSAINSNGARASLHAPSEVAQQECIRAAYRDADRDPKEVDFIELHATGKLPVISLTPNLNL
jgi:acyl transferase domain-containing protein